MNRHKIIFLTVAILILNVSSALACLCDKRSTFSESLEQSAAIFSGKVIKAEYQKKHITDKSDKSKAKPTDNKAEYEVLVITFEVERWWKGGTTTEVSLFTGQAKLRNGTIWVTSCDNEYILGEKYLVFAYGDKDRLVSGSVCSLTKKLNEAKKELGLLGEGVEPEKTNRVN